jgi:hypothetical protein
VTIHAKISVCTLGGRCSATLDSSRIAAAISYYGDYADEIDAEIAEADDASARAEAAWRVQQQLIA